MIKIRFNNDVIESFSKGITPVEIIQQQNLNFATKPIAALFNEKAIELNRPLEEDGTLEIMIEKHEKSLEILNHSTAHLMAQAIKRLYPEALFVVGPTIKEGFYYDIDFQNSVVSENDFATIEKMMQTISQEKLAIMRKEVSYEEAEKLFADNIYKQTILKNIKDPILSVYTQGEFTDLCRGIHMTNTKFIKHFKLLKTSGSYFQGSVKNKALTRIYGISFFNRLDLKNYLNLLLERKQRDHKNINKEQNYFMLSPEVGAGLPFWLPKGATIRRILERYIVDKELSYGYQHVYTPIIANTKLYEESGHLELYKDNMFPIMELKKEEKLVLRPMNCPHHMMIFKQQLRSYKDLPLKIAELGMMHRYEHSGAVSGLQRVREMTLNDAHIFITQEQIKTEFVKIMNLIFEVYKDFNITDYFFNLSIRDPENKDKYFDDDNMWHKSESILKEILNGLSIKYKEQKGDAAFYGPKLDVQVLTALGNEETLSTIQLDFLLPQRFNLTYIGEDSKEHAPIVIHRAVISTVERFLAYLIEQNKGVFPLWLTPLQVVLIPVNAQLHLEHTKKIQEILLKHNLRVEINNKEATLGYKIRESQKAKIPFQIVIGDQELTSNRLTYREYGDNKKNNVSVEEFVSMLNDKIQQKK
ncbi:MAG: threonine--tRNA ligase [Candidatus Phytoplasma pruni]|nr:threonine--tRNA ligase [Candidatus Phytoplasma pruni]